MTAHFYFGKKTDNVLVDSVYQKERFLAIKKAHPDLSFLSSVSSLYFLKQTHSSDVIIINADDCQSELVLFDKMGDAIITQQKNIGIGVLTADCLPVVLIDDANQAIAVIHAGWRGLYQHIITKTIDAMTIAFKTDASALQAFLGPSAGVCCYEVQHDFVMQFQDGVIEKRDQRHFFDGIATAIAELEKNGLSKQAINTAHHQCTLCSTAYCSYRREKENAGRQPTIALLT